MLHFDTPPSYYMENIENLTFIYGLLLPILVTVNLNGIARMKLNCRV